MFLKIDGNQKMPAEHNLICQHSSKHFLSNIRRITMPQYQTPLESSSMSLMLIHNFQEQPQSFYYLRHLVLKVDKEPHS